MLHLSYEMTTCVLFCLMSLFAKKKFLHTNSNQIYTIFIFNFGFYILCERFCIIEPVSVINTFLNSIKIQKMKHKKYTKKLYLGIECFAKKF